VKLLAVVLLSAVPVFGQSLPDKPARTIDREFVAETAALGAAWTADTLSTNSRFHWCDAHYGTRLTHQPDCFEGGGFFNGTRDTAKIMGAWAAVDLAAIGASYLWKRYVHNRYLHPLWRVPLIVCGEEHGRAAIGDIRYEK
jgi:hypothetical protein